jgi:hypothetical protein
VMTFGVRCVLLRWEGWIDCEMSESSLSVTNSALLLHLCFAFSDTKLIGSASTRE